MHFRSGTHGRSRRTRGELIHLGARVVDALSAATWRSLGLGLEYVRRQMGHKSISTTITNYGRLEPSMHNGAADRAEAALMDTGTTAVPRAVEA